MADQPTEPIPPGGGWGQPPQQGPPSCPHCHSTYDPQDQAALALHTQPVDCDCARCRGRPACYSCGGSFCFCGTHL